MHYGTLKMRKAPPLVKILDVGQSGTEYYHTVLLGDFGGHF